MTNTPGSPTAAPTVVRLPEAETGAQPIPRPIRFPSDYGLAGAVSSLLRDYGPIGTINRLIEAARAVEAGENPLRIVHTARRVELTEQYPAGRDGKRA